MFSCGMQPILREPGQMHKPCLDGGWTFARPLGLGYNSARMTVVRLGRIEVAWR